MIGDKTVIRVISIVFKKSFLVHETNGKLNDDQTRPCRWRGQTISATTMTINALKLKAL